MATSRASFGAMMRHQCAYQTALLLLGLTTTCIDARGIKAVVDQMTGQSGFCTLSSIERGWFTTSYNVAGCKHINGTGQSLSDTKAAALGASLRDSEVMVLTLSHTSLSSAGAAALTRSLVQFPVPIAGLILDNNDIGPDAAESIVNMLSTNTRVAVLDLQHNRLGPDAVLKILLALEDNKGLLVLSLNDNGVHDTPSPQSLAEGGIARGFSGILHESTDLKVLRVGSTGITESGVQMIMDALAHNTKLEEFEIGFQSAGASGAELIADALRSNKALRKLTIDGSNIGDDGAAEIAHALQFNTALHELSVESNELSPAAAKHFAVALEAKASTLRALRLGYQDHGMSAEWWHYIESLLDCNRRDIERTGECKERVIEDEEDRSCDILKKEGLDCKVFFQQGFTRVADLLTLNDIKCKDLEGHGLNSAHHNACVTIAHHAHRAERNFDEL